MSDCGGGHASLIHPPVFANEEQTRTARLLYAFLWILMLAFTAMGIFAIILRETISHWLTAMVLVDVAGLMLLSLARRGRTRLASILLVLELWAIAAALSWTAGGIYAPSITLNLFVVFIAGLLLGARVGLITAVCCSLAGLGMVYAEAAGLLPASAVQHTPSSVWIGNTMFLLIIVGFQYLANGAINDALRQARRELAERRQVEEELRQHREHLEELVEERTGEAERKNLLLEAEIAERRRTEDQLLLQKMQFQQLFENIALGIALLDKNQRIVRINKHFEKIFQYSENEIIGLPIDEVVVPPQLAEEGAEIGRRTSDEGIVEKETVRKRKDGALVNVQVYSVSMKVGDSQTGIYAIYEDITERKRVEEALAAERNLLRTLIDNLPDFIYAKDAEGRFTVCNIGVAHHMGAPTPSELVGKTDFDFYPRQLATQYYADEQAIIQSGQLLINREEPSIDAAGNPKWDSTTKVPLRDPQGKIIGLVGISRDITERKKAEVEREKLINELQSALADVKTLSGLVPICANCKKIRDDKGYWTQLEAYVQERSHAHFSHGICPDCAKALYPDYYPKAKK